MAQSSTKTHVWTVVITGLFIIAGAIISSPHWFKYFFPEQFLEQESIRPELLSRDASDEDKLKDSLGLDSVETGIETIVIEELELCPVNSAIPSYFFLKVKNRGTKTLRNLLVTVDFGRAKYEQFDYFLSAHNRKASIDSTHNNVISVALPKLTKNDTFSMYCLLSQPVFNTITITGGNLRIAKEYSYQEFITSGFDQGSSSISFFGFLLVLTGLILIVFSAYFCMIVYHFLMKKELIS